MFNQPPIFPTYALPASIRDAVFEVQQNMKAPPALIISSALGVLSQTIQGQIDVRFPYGKVSPVSLFLITIASSGERKTSVDSLFMKPISYFEEKSKQKADADIVLYEAELLAWEIRSKALAARILKLEEKEATSAC